MPERALRPLLCVTALVFVLLLALPQTGWLARLQVRSLAVPGFITDNREGREKRVAENGPNDFQLQLARVLAPTPPNSPSSAVKVQRLTALVQRFPNEPTLYAHLLRYYTQGLVLLHREEQNELSPETSGLHWQPPRHSLPADLEAFDQAAAQGENLDPDNAYFPLMRAAGLYEAGKDDLAAAALHRAAQKPRYEDYTITEFVAEDRLYREAHGRQGAIARVVLSASQLFPHYSQVRAVARMSTVSAIHAERAGNKELGVQLRQDTIKVGALMRVQGRSLIANLVGMAITAIPVSQPGGASYTKMDSGNWNEAQKEAWQQQKREKYYAYLTGLGHADEAKWTRAEHKADVEARSISRKITDNMTNAGLFSMRELMKTGIWWVAGMLTLSNALALLLLGSAAFLARRIRPTVNLAFWRGALCVGVLLVLGMFVVNVGRMATDLYSTNVMIYNLGDAPSSSSGEQIIMAQRMIGIAFSLAVPFVLLLTIAIASVKSRTAFVSNLGRWLRVTAVPAACILVLLYGLMLAGTARQENRMAVGLNDMVRHEAAFQAGLIGQKWPGAVK